MSTPQTKVSVFRRGELIREQEVSPGRYTLGPDAMLRPLDAAEAPTEGYARLTIRDRDCTVEDCGDADATIVDDVTVNVPTIILPGQRVRVGETEMIFHWPAGPDNKDAEARPRVSVRRPQPEEMRGPNRYEIGRMVARGGMGVIMSARDQTVQREVAMKLMIDGTKAETVARFYQEAQITAQLEHPNIVPVHELSMDEHGQPFYTMKLVRGISLKRVLERLANGDLATAREWPLSALLIVFQKICDAIAFAHARGVIHRDLKPDNIMLGEYGEAQVMDWGLAKVLGQDHLTTSQPVVQPADPDSTVDGGETTVGPTISGTVIGTPQYMPPEQANGLVEQMDERTDIYSLGAILYHILVLRPPFNGRNSNEVLQEVRRGHIVPMADAAAQKRLVHIPGGRVPESLAAVVTKAMSLEKVHRYPAVKLLQNEIEDYQEGFATAAEQAGVWKLAALFLRRHRTVSIAAGLLLLSGIIFSINLARARDRAERASIQAQAARKVADEQRDVAENQLYLSDMLQAGRHLADGRPESARELLQRHRRERSGRDLRGWEWYYLDGEANEDRLHVVAHPGGVFAVAASADGTRLLTGGADGEIAVWQARGLVPQFRLRVTRGAVQTVAWHPDGKWIAAGAADGHVRVWEVETQKLVAEVKVSDLEPVRTIGWRPKDDGTPTLAIGSGEKEILMWKPLASSPAGAPEKFATTKTGVASLHWSADGKRIASAELDTSTALEVFDFASRNKVLSVTPGSGNDAFSVALDPTGKFVAAGSKHLQVVVFDLASRSLISKEALHRGFISSLVWSPDGQRLASASHDGTIRLSSPLEDKGAVQILSGHRGEVNALAWLKLPGATGEVSALFSGGADGTLRAWVPTANSGGAFTVGGKNWISAANWNPAGTRLAVANFRDPFYLADPASGLSHPIRPTHGNIFDAVWSPTGDRLATTSRGNDRVEVFEAASGRSLGIFGLPLAYRAAWSPSGKYLAACGPKGARVWDPRTGELLVVISNPAGSIAWHPDERRIILGRENGAIELWDIATGKQAATWRAAVAGSEGSVSSEHEPPHQVYDLRWSPDLRQLAFSTQDGVAGVLSARDGQLLRTFPGHVSGVWRIVWNADGTRLATAGQDGMLRVFETATGGQVAHISHGLGTAELHALDWSRDGHRLVSGGFDRYVRIWDARRGERLEAVEDLARQVQANPNDLPKLRELARLYTQLGWADDARRTFARAQALAPDDGALTAAATESELSFARSLDAASSDAEVAPGQDARAIVLLAALHEAWEQGKGSVALTAWREIAELSTAAEVLPLARTYLSRARWAATWFPSKIDPLTDLDGWRAQASSADAVTSNVRSINFPYARRGPKDLLLNGDLTGRGPAATNFGMIARTRFELPAGKWRFRVVGGEGARVLVNGEPILENWAANAPLEKTAEYEQAATGAVDIIVEHFVRTGTDGFQFQLEPVE